MGRGRGGGCGGSVWGMAWGCLVCFLGVRFLEMCGRLDLGQTSNSSLAWKKRRFQNK